LYAPSAGRERKDREGEGREEHVWYSWLLRKRRVRGEMGSD
jgi:hypothetical protein